MTHCLECHAHFYLSYAENHPQDWRWFDAEWDQILQTWRWLSTVNHHSELVYRYVRVFNDFQDWRGLHRESVTWCKQGLAAARKLSDRRRESIMLHALQHPLT